MQRYPDAKVILTVRDPERWYESVRGTIYNVQSVASSLVLTLSGLFVPRVNQLRRVARMSSKLAWEDVFGGRFEERGYATGVFERWNDEVKRRVPAERLLVYEVKDGWEPLCDFLGVAVPEGKPFPHLNDAEAFRKMLRRRRALASAGLIGGASLIGFALLYLLSRTSPRRA
jgi:Sulfotransferase domain